MSRLPNQPRRQSSFRPGLETLEGREVPASVTLSTIGVVTISGGATADSIRVSRDLNGTVNNPYDDRLKIEGAGLAAKSAMNNIPFAKVTKIVFQGNGGNDTFANASAKPCVAYGGAGNDRLFAGSAASQLFGDAGDDLLVSVGGSKADQLTGGAGNDSFWCDAEATEKLLDLSPAERAAGHAHRIAGFATIRNATSGWASVSRERLGQALIDPTPDETSLTWRNYSDLSLFSAVGPSMNDVDQGSVGDCYFVATLSAVAKARPDRVRQLVTDLGDGTYAVHFHNAAGQDVFVRVDGDLATRDGRPIYAGVGGSAVWVAIVEKAWAFFRTGEGTYESIAGGNGPGVKTDQALGLTSVAYDMQTFPSGTVALQVIESNLAAGKAITIGGPTALGPNIDLTDPANWDRGQHIFTVDAVLTDAAGNKSLRVRNPWGSGGPNNDGYITVPSSIVAICCGGFRVYNV